MNCTSGRGTWDWQMEACSNSVLVSCAKLCYTQEILKTVSRCPKHERNTCSKSWPYADRTFGNHCHSGDPGCNFAASDWKGKSQVRAHLLRLQPQTGWRC